MALTGKLKPKDEKKEERYIATFDNGTLQQLRELFEFLKEEGFTMNELKDVLRVSIAMLVTAKEDKENQKSNK